MSESRASAGRKSNRLACDRCFALKEKCDFQASARSVACSRCTRLAKPCVTSRKQRTTGRPRKRISTSTRPQAGAEFVWHREQVRSQETTQQAFENGGSLPQDRLLALLPAPPDTLMAGKSPHEILLLNGVFSRRDFMCRFVLGKSFVDGAANRLLVGLRLFPDDMSNVFLAISARFARKMKNNILQEQDTHLDYAHGAKAVRTLRQRCSATRLEETDLKVILMLGLGVLTLDLLDSGLHSHTIVRFTIDVVQHFYKIDRHGTTPQPNLRHGLDADLIPLVFMDTCNCIVRREVPVYRLQPQNPEIIDRYIGLCSSLLPHLYDICSLSRDLGNSSTAAAELEGKLDTVENRILRWEPPPEEYPGRLAAHEMDSVRVQARIYRLAALLIIYRLRFPFGRQNQVAAKISQDILTDVESLYGGWSVATRMSSNVGARQIPSADSPFEYRLGFPFLVASIEVEDPMERQRLLEIANTVVRVRMYPNVSRLMRQFLVYIWDVRDRGTCGYWFDWVPDGPPLILF